MAFFTAALALAGTAQAYHQINAKIAFRKNIDPIVKPGEYTSHMHSFFGSDQVTVNVSNLPRLTMTPLDDAWNRRHHQSNTCKHP